MLFNFLLQADFESIAADTIATTAPLAETAPQQQEMTFSLIEMATKGGWLMIVLLILSIIAIYIFGKKLWMIKKAGNVDKYFMEDITDLINAGKIKTAMDLCYDSDTPVARLVEKGIERLGRPLSDIQTAIENTANVEVARIEKGIPYLAMVAGGAPMIGFLGTVTGMIRAFFNMSQAGNNIDITLLSSGIYEAMVTTVGGLVVGILAYFAYNYLTAQVSNLVFKMENSTIEFMDLLQTPEE